jgi:exonuclease V gamma subunit
MQQISSIIYKILGGKQENKEELSSLQLQWMIFDLMGAADFKKQFPLIADYFGTDFQKRFALAGKVAALFTKYQTFIPEKISDWKNKCYKSNENELWQEFLWTKLKETIKDSFYTEIDSY